jgi:hypothetical protein
MPQSECQKSDAVVKNESNHVSRIQLQTTPLINPRHLPLCRALSAICNVQFGTAFQASMPAVYFVNVDHSIRTHLKNGRSTLNYHLEPEISIMNHQSSA